MEALISGIMLCEALPASVGGRGLKPARVDAGAGMSHSTFPDFTPFFSDVPEL